MVEPRPYTYEAFPADTELPAGAEEIQTKRDDRMVFYFADVEYDRYENGALTLQILQPKYADERPAKFPCIVFVQGSGWGVQKVHINIPPLSRLAEKGYVVAVVQYRHSAIAPFPAQIIDAKTAVKFLRANADAYSIDERNIVIFGDSSGGHTALMVNITAGLPAFASEKYPGVSDAVIACVDLYGPTALYEMNNNPSTQDHLGPDSPEGMLFGKKSVLENMELAKKADPVTHLEESRKIAPILMFHGDKDPLVPFQQSVRLYKALRAANKEVSFYKMLGAEHGGPSFWTDDVLTIIDRFIRTHLNP